MSLGFSRCPLRQRMQALSSMTGECISGTSKEKPQTPCYCKQIVTSVTNTFRRAVSHRGAFFSIAPRGSCRDINLKHPCPTPAERHSATWRTFQLQLPYFKTSISHYQRPQKGASDAESASKHLQKLPAPGFYAKNKKKYF